MKTFSTFPRKKTAQKGITLIELIITVSILAMITAACATFMTASANMIAANEHLLQDEQNIRQALLTITRELRTLTEDNYNNSGTMFGDNVLSMYAGSKYELRSDNKLYLNGVEFMSGIKVFKCVLVDSGRFVKITIQGEYSMEVETKIRLRFIA